MDIATIVGLIAFVTALMVGVGSNLSLFVDPPSLIIVLGGGLALTLISLPLQNVVGLVGVVWRALFVRVTSPTEVIERSVRMAEMARAGTILALEQDVDQNETDPFLAAGARLAVDGTEPDLIMDIMETELNFIEERHQQSLRSVALVGRNCMAMGVLATLLAAVIGSHHGADPGKIVLFSALGLLYGGIAWALMTAVADKLRRYSEMEMLVKRLTIEAIMCIQSGDNPRIVQHKLSVFLQPAMRPSGDISTDRPAPAPQPDDDFVQEVRRLAAENGPDNFAFERIVDLTDKDLDLLLRQVDQSSLVIAMVGATEPVRARLLDGMSPRVKTFLLEETGFVKNKTAEDVAGMHAAIANQVARMAQQGQISLP